MEGVGGRVLEGTTQRLGRVWARGAGGQALCQLTLSHMSVLRTGGAGGVAGQELSGTETSMEIVSGREEVFLRCLLE